MKDSNGVLIDPQDKLAHCEGGAKREVDFVEKFGPGTDPDLPVCINPEKDGSPVGKLKIDLQCGGVRPGDVKWHGTPFFTSLFLDGILPVYCCSLNDFDPTHYVNRYRDAEIYIWINWEILNSSDSNMRGGNIPVKRIESVHVAMASDIIKAGYRIHPYKNREGDRVNKQSSYIFDYREYPCLWADAADDFWGPLCSPEEIVCAISHDILAVNSSKYCMPKCQMPGGCCVPVFQKGNIRTATEEACRVLARRGVLEFRPGNGLTKSLSKNGYLSDTHERGVYFSKEDSYARLMNL